ncbi:tagaturonate reductase [Bariatricus sp. SGI.154]|uniref:tagaturonate reductase n=1 Tax=Bariatricus sp. SGI.154 TaxID=3420549 RepID=UPI003D02E0E9
MKRLSYEVLKEQNYDGYLLKDAPEKVLQFGEGNFLRAFVDYFFDNLNEKADFNGKVTVVQPLPKHTPTSVPEFLNEQEGLYTLYLRGFENGQEVNAKRVISCVSRCINAYSDYEELMKCADNPELRYITSNTTEAGIVYDPACQFTDAPASSYPGKLTQFLYRRFERFGNEKGKGFIILACELIDDNGKVLKDCVIRHARQWNLSEEFIQWVEAENVFCSTLVDRIVTGYPRTEADAINEANGYEDKVLNTGEVFGFWVIEGPEWLNKELPFAKAGLPVIITDNHKPYKQRKVRILNGAHTSMVLGAYLAGQDIVRNCMADEVICRFMNKAIYEEIIPTLTLPKDELESFAFSVTERFKNPFIDHALLSISLNSTSKWKARVLPTVKDYIKNTGMLPTCLTTSFALYIAFYRGNELTDAGLKAVRPNGDSYTISDDRSVLEFYLAHKDDSARDLAYAVCQNTDFWGEDLSALPGFSDMVAGVLERIETKGTYEVMKDCL